MPSEGDFQAGSFYFPTGGGSFSVPLDLDPQGVIFFGGNQSTEDTLIHPAHPGIFFGMAWLDVDTGLVDFQSQANTTIGLAWDQCPILCLSNGAATEYRASSITFDPGGFTLTVSTPAPGPRLIHYLAWGGFDGAEGKSVAGTSGGQIFDFPSLGYRPLSALEFGMFSTLAARSGTNSGVNYFTLATACFPEEDTNTLNDNASALTMYAPLVFGQGLTVQWHQWSDDAMDVNTSGGVLGYWQDQHDHLYPYPSSDSEALRLTSFGNGNRAQLVWWDCEGSVHNVNAPNLAATNSIVAPSYINELQAALFFSTTGYNDNTQLSANSAYVLGVLTPDYQGVVAYDTGFGTYPADGTPSFFQSQNACFANSLSPSGGIRVASGVMDDSTVTLTGEIATNSQIGSGFVHLWGKEVLNPGFFRRY